MDDNQRSMLDALRGKERARREHNIQDSLFFYFTIHLHADNDILHLSTQHRYVACWS